MWLFSHIQYCFRSSRSTPDLLKVVSDIIVGAFDRSGATRAVIYPKLLTRCDMPVFSTNFFTFYGISGKIFVLISSFLSNRQLWVVLDGKSSQEYSIKSGVPQGTILGLFLLYINDLPDDAISSIAIFANDTTL